MLADQNQVEQLAELKKKNEILQQQLALVNTQYALDIAKLTQEAQLAQTVAEVQKKQASTQFELESEKAKLPFAKLAGIKAGLGDAQLPVGKSGTVQVAAGTVGTALLRSKRPLLILLKEIAENLNEQIPQGAVIVTESQLGQAYQSDFMLMRIDQQTKDLIQATSQAKPKAIVAQTKVVGEAIAAVYSMGFVLETINSLTKLFRVDREVDVFTADDEVRQMLGYFLEIKNPAIVTSPELVNKGVMSEAARLIDKLNALLKAVYEGENLIAQLKTIKEDEIKKKSTNFPLPTEAAVTDLNVQIQAARSFLDGLDPARRPEAFWSQVKGQLIARILDDKDRLLLKVNAQVLQITESQFLRPDVIKTTGEVQVAYRILNEDGKIKKTGVILKASKPELVVFDKMADFSFTTATV